MVERLIKILIYAPFFSARCKIHGTVLDGSQKYAILVMARVARLSTHFLLACSHAVFD
jgi:hypothetical protein